MKAKKVKMVAIAKDEGLYLPEWIAHHLSLGISKIHVILNGITDLSEIICERISQHYPLTYEYGDELKTANKMECDHLIAADFLKNNPLQSRAFAQDYLATNVKDVDYILYIDIDEFLCIQPNDISRALSVYNDFDFLKIRTFSIDGENKDFLLNIRYSMTGQALHLTKYILKTGLSHVKFKSTHVAITENPEKRFFAGYGVIDKDCNQKEAWTDNFFILHQEYRSPVEYLSTLGRGANFLNNKLGLKKNRPGWMGRRSSSISAPIQEEIISASNNYYKNLLEKTNIQDLLIAQEIFVKNRAKNVCEKINQFAISTKEQLDEASKLKKALSGTHLEFLFENTVIN